MHPIQPETLALGFIWYAVFLFSTTCHEASHALAAKIGGDPTAFHGGQVTLNPAPHIRREPFGMVLVPILSYVVGGWMIGWGSAPYAPWWQERSPRRSAWTPCGAQPPTFSPPAYDIHRVKGSDPSVLLLHFRFTQEDRSAMRDRFYVATRKGLFTVDRRVSKWSISRATFVGDNITLVMHDRRNGNLFAAF